MGVILDTSILIDAERSGQSVSQILGRIRTVLGRAAKGSAAPFETEQVGPRWAVPVEEVALPHLRRIVEPEVGLSVVTIAELTHGAYRAKNLEQLRRLRFIEVLSQALPVYHVTVEIARTVGMIGAALAVIGITLEFEDLAIGVTALELGFAVATKNVKHFQPISDVSTLEIITC